RRPIPARGRRALREAVARPDRRCRRALVDTRNGADRDPRRAAQPCAFRRSRGVAARPACADRSPAAGVGDRGRPAARGATEAYVAEAYLSGAYASETDASETGVAGETAAGETAVPRLPAVLKLMVPPGDRARHGLTPLRLADGHGCATLYREDAALGAVLVERLGPPLFDLGLPVVRRHEILCDTAARLWRPAAGHGLPTGADRAREVAGYVTDTWTELDRPCSEAAIEDAVRCAERRAAAHDDERAVLVHGDVHQLNALRSGTGFKLIDPD